MHETQNVSLKLVKVINRNALAWNCHTGGDAWQGSMFLAPTQIIHADYGVRAGSGN